MISLIDSIYIIALAAIWILLFYHILLVIGGYRKYAHHIKTIAENTMKEDNFYPFVSVIVPAHNEAMVIEKSLIAILRMHYPLDKMEVILVNDCSTDKTGPIAEKIADKDNRLKVLTLTPAIGKRGKANALTWGIKKAKGDFIAIYDADNTPEHDALRHLVEHMLVDDKLGATVGRFRTRNQKKNLLTRFINIETIAFQWMIQAGRNKLFRLTTIPGTNFLVRRKIIEEIGGWKSGALTEDTEMSFRIYNDGYLIDWVPEAVTWEQEPEKLKIWFKQRTRWCRGNISVVLYFLFHFRQLRYPRCIFDLIYFSFMYLFFFSFVILSDLIFLFGTANMISISLTGPFTLIWILAYVMFVIETFIMLNMERNEATLKNLLIVMLMYFTYCQLWLFVVLKSIIAMLGDILQKKQPEWDKTVRSME